MTHAIAGLVVLVPINWSGNAYAETGGGTTFQRMTLSNLEFNDPLLWQVCPARFKTRLAGFRHPIF